MDLDAEIIPSQQDGRWRVFIEISKKLIEDCLSSASVYACQTAESDAIAEEDSSKLKAGSHENTEKKSISLSEQEGLVYLN